MIHTKLLEIQKLNITPTKDGTNPHFGNSYVTLNEVLGKLKKPLNDAGIVIIQRPTTVEGTYGEAVAGLSTELIDTEDNTEVTAFIPYTNVTDAQKLGSCITYFRRYSLMALLGLEDDDDDGEKASVPAKKSKGVVDRDDEPFPTKGDTNFSL